ncbi:MAG TPA: aldolase/citrate lyase family protein [Limnochorda sp.]
MSNRVKERLKQGLPTVGTWINLPEPAVAEILAAYGMDWLVIDTEHGPMDWETVENLLRAMKGTEVVPLIRVAGNDPFLIKKALDRGAMGILVPMVNSAEEARAAVAAAKYPPEGFRGMAGTRASRYGLDMESYVESWNRDVLVVIQVETRAGLEHVESIAAVPGVDVLFVGPNDLSASLGIFRQYDHPLFQDAVRRIRDAARACGVAPGYMGRDAASVLAKVDEGFTFIAAGTDVGLLKEAASATYRAIRQGLQDRRLL